MSSKTFLSSMKNPNRQYSLFITIILIFTIISTFYFWTILFPFILGITLAFMMDPIVNMLTKFKIKRSLSIFIICVLIICLMLFLSQIIPMMVIQLSKLVSGININLSMDNPSIKKTLDFLSSHGMAISFDKVIGTINKYLSSQLNSILSSFVGFITSSFKVIVDVLIALLSFYYILKEKDLVLKNLRLLIPPHKFDTVVSVNHQIIKQIHSFIKSVIILAFVVFVFMLLLLQIFGAPFATPLAILSGIISAIPYIGPVVQICLIALIQLIQMYPIMNIVWMILIQTIFFTFMAFYLHPLVTGKSVKIHPLVVIFCLVIGGHLGGVFGMLICIPIYIIIRILFIFYFEKYKPKDALNKQ